MSLVGPRQAPAAATISSSAAARVDNAIVVVVRVERRGVVREAAAILERNLKVKFTIYSIFKYRVSSNSSSERRQVAHLHETDR